jgi:hypothetical protein
MKTIWIGALLLSGLAGCGSFIKAPVSRDELAKVHKVGVAAVFDDQFHGRQLGWTVFGNQRFDADIAGWEVNKLAQQRAVEALRQGNPRLQVEALQVPGAATVRADHELTWLGAAQQQGFDTVVLLEPATSDNYPMFAPGVGVYSRGKFACVYTAYVVAVYDVAARKQIAWEWGASPPCKLGAGDPGVQFKPEFAQYSAADLDAMRKLLDTKFTGTLPVALEGVHLTGAKP